MSRVLLRELLRVGLAAEVEAGFDAEACAFGDVLDLGDGMRVESSTSTSGLIELAKGRAVGGAERGQPGV